MKDSMRIAPDPAPPRPGGSINHGHRAKPCRKQASAVRCPEFLAAVAALVLAGCAGDGPVALDSERSMAASASMAQSPGAPLDISGSWVWTREEHLNLSAWAAANIFGIQPEGPMTIARCTFVGTMEVIQTGTTFEGAYDLTGGGCVTRGEEPFAGPSGPPEPFTGRITGRSVRLWIDGFLVDCVHHAVVSKAQGNRAVAMEGSAGRCIIPGHPKSTVPGFDPPPAGTEVFTSWLATRP